MFKFIKSLFKKPATPKIAPTIITKKATEDGIETTYTIPVGNLTKVEVKEHLSKLTSDYKGEIESNNEDKIPYKKEYWFVQEISDLTNTFNIIDLVYNEKDSIIKFKVTPKTQMVNIPVTISQTGTLPQWK